MTLIQLVPSELYVNSLLKLGDAINIPNSLDQQIADSEKLAVVLIAHALPFALVITLFVVPLLETAANSLSSGDQHMEIQLLSAALVPIDHVIPFVLVITLFPDPLPATATNSLSSGDQHTDCHEFVAAAVAPIQFIPSLLYATLFDPIDATATNILSSGDQHTDCHPEPSIAPFLQ